MIGTAVGEGNYSSPYSCSEAVCCDGYARERKWGVRYNPSIGRNAGSVARSRGGVRIRKSVVERKDHLTVEVKGERRWWGSKENPCRWSTCQSIFLFFSIGEWKHWSAVSRGKVERRQGEMFRWKLKLPWRWGVSQIVFTRSLFSRGAP